MFVPLFSFQRAVLKVNSEVFVSDCFSMLSELLELVKDYSVHLKHFLLSVSSNPVAGGRIGNIVFSQAARANSTLFCFRVKGFF
jgi:hypothetical protein